MLLENTLSPIEGPMSDGKYLVSNTEATNFLTCERKHFYAHILKLAPKGYSTSLTRGIIGHEALAAYYTVLQQDPTAHEQAQKEMLKVVTEYAVKGNADMEMLLKLRTLLTDYVNWYGPRDKIEILEVEKQHDFKITDELYYSMRLDLYVKYLEGEHKGECAVWDHKFVYDFYTLDDLSVNVQLPKYLATLIQEGKQVNFAVLNQIRHRVTKAQTMTDKFRRSTLTPTHTKMRNMMIEHIKTSEKIIERKRMTEEAASSAALRSMNKMTCKNCPFLMLCTMELEGSNTKSLLASEFMPNTYGYDELESA